MDRFHVLPLPAPRRGTKLPAGGIYGLHRQTGHYEVAQEAAEQFGFTSPAVSILRDAAQDPDFYEWSVPAAHAQTPDEVDLGKVPDRSEAIEASQEEFLRWGLGNVERARAALAQGDLRETLYWVGYLLHGVQDLAPHAGRTNAEHAWNDPNPDLDAGCVELARSYTLETLRALRETFGAQSFDALRSFDGEGKFSRAEKKERLHPGGWDFSFERWREYHSNGEAYGELDPPPAPVRWPRERVLGRLLGGFAAAATKGEARPRREEPATGDRFVPLVSLPSPKERASWTLLVYMAGDDLSPDGIEYAVEQDLREMKEAGSTASVHLLAQTDEATRRNSFRYRLRKGTALESDRLEIFRGDLNTGRVSTLVDFVRWGKERFPAERYGLVLWGHGSGHDDRDVYRLARGSISRRLATQVARKRLGFFRGTRRTLLERGGPARGFGFDDTAGDFLDGTELRAALREIAALLGAPLDLLGFDACLMGMAEVAYQARENVRVMVASQLPEPGDGWRYDRALALLLKKPDRTPEALAKGLVREFDREYGGAQTLSAIQVDRIVGLAGELRALSPRIAPEEFHRCRRAARDCGPEGRDGYRDLGGFLAALGAPAAAASAALGRAVVETCGGTSGLSIYLPGDYRPEEPGGTDEIYEGLDFPHEGGWAGLLRRIYAPPSERVPGRGVPRSSAELAGVAFLHALDRHHVGAAARAVLEQDGDPSKAREADRALRARASPARDLLRVSTIRPSRGAVGEALRRMWESAGRWFDEDGDPREDPDVRVLLLPGGMGSLLSDRAGGHGLVWIDPIGLLAGEDFETLRLQPDGETDADGGVRLEAIGPVPVLYDRLALALTAEFGPVVEQVGYDWRKPLERRALDLARRIERILAASPRRRVALVAHSAGGLVAAEAAGKLDPKLRPRVLGLVAMGAPWRGMARAGLYFRGEGDQADLFSRLTGREPAEVAAVVQTFAGLVDLLPPDSPDLFEPRFYAPGPLSTWPEAGARLARARTKEWRWPEPTVAIVDDSHSTLTRVVATDGSWEGEEGPGDGSVPVASATAGGDIPSVRVRAGHVSLPFDGDAIRATVEQIGRWVHGSSYTFAGPLPGAGAEDLRASASRRELLARLEEPEVRPLSVADFAALAWLL
ncbi:MAG TPA: alpha/beta fold hydrolase [Planctomycetota bacterium]|jgi:pimeloyl-ACP methyl ester carboxylesterase|nr:alpha/beta fold hydrolase [Planctomycetota bacterium]